MKLSPAVVFLFPFTLAWAASPQHPICSPPPPRTATPLRNSDFAGVRADLLSGNRQQALHEAEDILDAHPGNAEASFMIGTLLLDYGQPAEALVCFRKAQAAWPGSTDVHAGLLEAFAETGDRKDRDIERAILRGYHADGRHPSAARTPGIVIERFHAGDRQIEAVEYFDPQGPDHVYYRFNVADPHGVIVGWYAFAADDADQAAYHQAHPDVARTSLRRYALESFINGNSATLGTFDGNPSYDDFRSRIVAVAQTQSSTATAATPAEPAPSAPKKNKKN